MTQIKRYNSGTGQWESILPGVQGAQGPQGNQGLQGTQGNQGVQGFQGAQGPQGNQGTQGVQGAQGVQGTVGSGFASGGSVGQVLVKNSGTNYDSSWASLGFAGRSLLTAGAYLSGSGLVLANLSGNYASAPDSNALDVIGDIDIRVKAALTDWTPATVMSLVCKSDVNTQRSYEMFVNATTGIISLRWTTNGSTEVTASSTVAPTVADGATLWVRATLDVDNGASGYDAIFYTSTDGTTWTKLGNTVTGGATTSIYAGTAPLWIGIRQNNTWFLNGTVYRAQILNGIGGTTVFDADFSTQTADALSFTESSANAATVTINTTRYSYGLPNVQWSGVGTNALTANFDYYYPFAVNQSIIADMLAFEVTSGPASNSTTYFAIYNADNNNQPTGTPLATTSRAINASQTGVFYVSIPLTTLVPGPYVLAVNNAVTTTFRTLRGGPIPVGSGVGTSPFVLGSVSRTAATFTNTPLPSNSLTSLNVPLPVPSLLRWKAYESPLSLNPALWLDAADTSTITASGGAVSQWNDKSGNGLHVSQSDAAFRPVTGSTTQNGNNVLNFNVDRLFRSTPTNLIANITGATIYIVHRPTDLTVPASGYRAVLGIISGTAGSHRLLMASGFGTANTLNAGGRTLDADSFVRTDSSTKVAGTWYVQSAVYDYVNTDLFQYVNNSLDGSTTSFQTATRTSDIASVLLNVGGFQNDANNAYIGDIAEILVFHSAHNAGVRALIESYLNAKWKIY